MDLAARRHPADPGQLHDPQRLAARSLDRLRRRVRGRGVRHGVDAVLPGLVAGLHRDRGIDLLRTRRLRRPAGIGLDPRPEGARVYVAGGIILYLVLLVVLGTLTLRKGHWV